MAFDRDEKLGVYASGSVPQYLIINLSNNTVEVFEDPDPSAATYRTKMTAERGTTIRLNVGDGPRFEFDASDVLPEP